MKALFHKWLLLFVILAFGLTFSLSWFLHRKEAKKNSLLLLELNLKDVAGRVRRSETNLQTITEMSAASAIAKTRAFALLIQKTPSILKEPETLRLICRKLDVDELHVADRSGKLIASQVREGPVAEDYRHFNIPECNRFYRDTLYSSRYCHCRTGIYSGIQLHKGWKKNECL